MDKEYWLELRLEQAREVVRRLERISADSYWAHQSSGVRGSLWRIIERLEKVRLGKAAFRPDDLSRLESLLDEAHAMLVAAGREIPDPEAKNHPSGQATPTA
ncbi:hypothetical protein [Anaerolinea thermophila]|nr:hypothetical protein [Anaerolinea thermophila]